LEIRYNAITKSFNWFSMAAHQASREGNYRSVRQLIRAIRAYVDGWSDRVHAFTWMRTAPEILA
jgi:hypothetical protein